MSQGTAHAKVSVRGVHAIESGTLTANKTFLRGEGLGAMLRPVELCEFPVLAYVIEHREGPLVVDTGVTVDVPAPRTLRGFPPTPHADPSDAIGPQMQERGLDPAEVRTVVLTHLDWDHTAGLRYFPRAEVLVHRREHDFARTRLGRFRCVPSVWPDDFSPTLYELDPEPYGPFPTSRAITRSGDVRVVPLPGHSPGQVAVVYDTDEGRLMFAADHMLRADWFVEDMAAGRLVMLGPFAKKDARRTSRRLESFINARPTVLLPAHDSGAPGRLARGEVTRA